MEVSKQSQIALKSNPMGKQSGFYSSLSRSKQNIVTVILKELENLKNLAAQDEVKNKVMDESERIDKLADPENHNKNSDIPM